MGSKASKGGDVAAEGNAAAAAADAAAVKTNGQVINRPPFAFTAVFSLQVKPSLPLKFNPNNY